MKKAAILVDGEWFRRSLEIALKGQLPHGVTADVLHKNALLALSPDEELFRLFYFKRIVDRVILISGDTDMIPAMKLARREGVQVVLVDVAPAQGSSLSKALDEDTDLCRAITPVP